MRQRASGLLGFVAVLTIALAPACSGGGGGGGGGPTQPPGPGITFTPSQTAGDNSIYLSQGGATTVDRLFLEVRVQNVTNLYGVAFDVVYPSGQLAFARATEGTFITGQKDLQTAEPTPGRVVVGYTNLGGDEPESGSGLLMTLEFTAVASGSGGMTFDKEQAFTRGSVPYTVNFVGGTVRVQR